MYITLNHIEYRKCHEPSDFVIVDNASCRECGNECVVDACRLKKTNA